MDIYPQKRVLDALLQGTDWNKIPSYSQSKGIADYRSHGDGHSPTTPLYNSNRFQMRINTLKPNRQPGAELCYREKQERQSGRSWERKKGLRSLVTFTNWMCDQSVKPEWKKWGGVYRQTRCGPQMLFIRISFSSHFSFFFMLSLLFFVPICDWFERLVLEESVARGKRDPDGAVLDWKSLEQRESDRALSR